MKDKMILGVANCQKAVHPIHSSRIIKTLVTSIKTVEGSIQNKPTVK